MNQCISKKEYDKLNEKLIDLEEKRNKLDKALGKIMEGSSSSTSKTPGFTEKENELKVLVAKIEEINNILNRSKIIEDISDFEPDKVTVYSLVTVADTDTGEKLKYYIQQSADNNKTNEDFLIASPNSPIGSNLLDRKIGDKVEINLPKKTLKFKIIKIEKKFI